MRLTMRKHIRISSKCNFAGTIAGIKDNESIGRLKEKNKI